MLDLQDRKVTVAQAAFVSGVTQKAINREIDAKVIQATGHERLLRWPDLVYLVAVKEVKAHIAPALRKSIRKSIALAVRDHASSAGIALLRFDIAETLHAMEPRVEKFEQLDTVIEKREGVMGGEPVIRGTRIPVHHIAALLHNGATREELQEDFDLSEAQIQAAQDYAQIYPRRGRPRAKTSKASEAPRVFRRLSGLTQAAISRVSTAA